MPNLTLRNGDFGTIWHPNWKVQVYKEIIAQIMPPHFPTVVSLKTKVFNKNTNFSNPSVFLFLGSGFLSWTNPFEKPVHLAPLRAVHRNPDFSLRRSQALSVTVPRLRPSSVAANGHTKPSPQALQLTLVPWPLPATLMLPLSQPQSWNFRRNDDWLS